MSKFTMDPVKLMKVLEGEVKEMEQRKTRLIKESDDLQKEVNDLSEKREGIDLSLKEKEKELMKKVDTKLEEVSRKEKEVVSLRAEASALSGELQVKLKDAKEAEKVHRHAGDAVNVELENVVRKKNILEEIVLEITKRLKQI